MDEALKEKILEVIRTHTRRSPIKSGQVNRMIMGRGKSEPKMMEAL